MMMASILQAGHACACLHVVAASYLPHALPWLLSVLLGNLEGHERKPRRKGCWGARVQKALVMPK